MSLSPGELLAVMRVGGWRCALPIARVERVLSAAMPIKVPRGGGASFVVRLGEVLTPVIFGAELFGAEEVELRLSDKLVVLRGCVLWVDAVEDLTPYVPLNDAAPSGPFVACFSGGAESLAVLDLEKLSTLAQHPAPRPTPPESTPAPPAPPAGRSPASKE